MLGLAADDRWKMIEGMVKTLPSWYANSAIFQRLIAPISLAGHSRHFLHIWLRLVASHREERAPSPNIFRMLKEYRFWMKGRTKLHKAEHRAYARCVEMPNGMQLNRYYDNKMTPRPESLSEDVSTANEAPDRESDRLYLHLRAAAESGWDFSSRWFMEPNEISSIHTADIIPVDLNCLLYQLESTIAETYRLIKNPLLARRFQTLADRRAGTILEYCWDEKNQFFRWLQFFIINNQRANSLAAVFPLYARIATKQQADAVARRLGRIFWSLVALLAHSRTTASSGTHRTAGHLCNG